MMDDDLNKYNNPVKNKFFPDISNVHKELDISTIMSTIVNNIEIKSTLNDMRITRLEEDIKILNTNLEKLIHTLEIIGIIKTGKD